jgi:hypothetical protein
VISRILDSKKSSATQQMKAGDLSSGVSPRRLNERASALGRKGMRERRTRTPDPPHPSFTGSQGYATGGTVQSDLARAPVAFPAPPPTPPHTLARTQPGQPTTRSVPPAAVRRTQRETKRSEASRRPPLRTVPVDGRVRGDCVRRRAGRVAGGAHLALTDGLD